MAEIEKNTHWYFSKFIDMTMVIELVLLAALIVGTWVDLQKQLSLLQHDITNVLDSQQQFQQRIEELNRTSISYEYRLRSIEKYVPQADIGKDTRM